MHTITNLLYEWKALDALGSEKNFSEDTETNKLKPNERIILHFLLNLLIFF